jgi:hypothetical protein
MASGDCHANVENDTTEGLHDVMRSISLQIMFNRRRWAAMRERRPFVEGSRQIVLADEDRATEFAVFGLTQVVNAAHHFLRSHCVYVAEGVRAALPDINDEHETSCIR